MLKKNYLKYTKLDTDFRKIDSIIQNLGFNISE